MLKEFLLLLNIDKFFVQMSICIEWYGFDIFYILIKSLHLHELTMWTG